MHNVIVSSEYPHYFDYLDEDTTDTAGTPHTDEYIGKDTICRDRVHKPTYGSHQSMCLSGTRLFGILPWLQLYWVRYVIFCFVIGVHCVTCCFLHLF